MNARAAIKASDDIRTFLPGIGEAEYDLRAKLRTMRNCASALIANTDSDTARALAWTCSGYATAYVYAGADTETLSEIARFCNRLILTAMQAEQIDDGGGA
jgi:hypothetical protein